MEFGFEGIVRTPWPNAWVFWAVLFFSLLAGNYAQNQKGRVVAWLTDGMRPSGGSNPHYSNAFVRAAWSLSLLSAGLFSSPWVQQFTGLDFRWSTLVSISIWLLFFVGQYTLHTLVGALTKSSVAFAHYWVERNIWLRWTAALSVPMAWGWLLEEGKREVSIAYFSIAVLLYLIGILRGTLIMVQKSPLPSVHIFAYICTHELAPLLWALSAVLLL